ncbi:MAG: efflux RND transporter permease subunit [Treponema sp.]|jgi:multidrug efflux pump subunit AcrB|nr:efflux RND transporter permease subunit [Treponema sp.]
MKTLVSWLKRKKAAVCILAGILSAALFVIINSSEKIKQSTGGSYVVKIMHYGIDAAEMERTVTIPLEDALSAISGVMSVQSSTENSQSRIFVRFKPGGRGRYEAVRDAAQRVYETLPTSAQRPEILSSNNSRVPVWSAAVFTGGLTGGLTDGLTDGFGEVKENLLTAQMLEKIVKPRFERLEGAGEVLVSGVGLKEIIVILDQEKLFFLGLEPSDVAEALAMNDSIFSGGTTVLGGREIIITVDGRYGQSLDKAFIPLGNGKFIQLSDIAVITEQERMPDTLSRLNGRKTAGIAIMGRHDTDLRKLSSDIKKELAALSLPLEFTVLSDLGAEEAAAFRSVFNAALLGAIMVAVISFLLGGKNSANYTGFFCALAIPLICLLSVAVLSTIGFPVDRLMLAGIAAGVGTAVDAVILCSEKLRKSINYEGAAAALSELAGPLIDGAATTVAALLPLSRIQDAEVKTIASAIAVVCTIALVFSLSLLPPLFLWRLNSHTAEHSVKIPIRLKRAQRRLSRLLCKFLAVDVRFCIRFPVLFPAISLAVTAAAILVLFAKGVDTSSYGSQDSVYAQVEFEGGLLAEETDRLLAAYGEKLSAYTGIKNIETGARTGSGSLLISFDPRQTQVQIVKESAKQLDIPGGFVFFHESSNRDRYWEIRIYGDEDQKCRELAEKLAYICGGHPLIKERVLNFKQGSKKLILRPDRELFAESGIGFANAAAAVRYGVYGPVVYKRMDAKGETDVRIRTGGNVMRQSREGALGLLVSGIRIDSLVQTSEKSDSASIRRNDRRRTASITIVTEAMDPRRVKRQMEETFKKLDLPAGYSIEFDPDAITQADALASTVLSLVLAVIFCYMIIACINESFTVPLLVLSAIPASLAVPALCLALSGSAYNSAVACAFIAVSGMTVNAAVLCVDGLYAKTQNKNGKSTLGVYTALRRKMPALLSTTGTTIAGALPFLFLSEGANSLIRTLSLVGALGVACSCIGSITLIPSLFILKKHLTNIKRF